MKEITMDVFFNELNGLLDGLLEKEEKNIVAGAQIMADTIAKGGVIHVLGSGHSVGFAMEMQNRVGSLACVHKIETNDFVLKGKVTLDEFKHRSSVVQESAISYMNCMIFGQRTALSLFPTPVSTVW